MKTETGVARWMVNISKWDPNLTTTSDYFSYFMSFLPHHEHPSITRFVKMDDRKRGLISKLLQYALIHQIMQIPFDEIIIKRTIEGKPYLVENDGVKMKFPNLNFNVSHDGDYVGIACEPLCLVGLDIAAHSLPRKEEKVEDFIRNFSSYFSHLEWHNIMNADSPHEMLNNFYRYWCLKEAFVKAIGTGVGCRLDAIEFHHTMWQNITIKVNGQELKDWKFWLHDLDENHSVAMAKGHPRMACVNYKETLKQTEFSEDEYYRNLNSPDVSFRVRTVEDLILTLRGGSTI